MPSVRDILKGVSAGAAPVQQAAQNLGAPGADALPVGNQAADPQGLAGPGDEHLEMTQRLKETTDQKIGMAQQEIDRQTAKIDQFEEQIDQLQQAGHVPPQELLAQLENSQIRLDDARGDLARAQETRQNIDTVMEAQLQSHEEKREMSQSMAPQNQQEASNSLGSKVRDALGHKGAAKGAGLATGRKMK